MPKPWEDYRDAHGVVDRSKLDAAERALALSGLPAEEQARHLARFAHIRASESAPRYAAPALERASNAAVYELDLLGSVGESWWDEGFTASRVANALRDAGSRTIRLRINSSGGDAFEGDAIRTMLQTAPNRVEVEILALAASAASVIAMAGDQISMAENAILMIHRVATVVRGNVDAVRSSLQLLEASDAGAAAIYARRSGKSSEEMHELMRKETWLTAREAVELGLADKIIPGLAAVQAAGEIPAEVLAKLQGLPSQSARDTTSLVSIASRLGLPADATEEQVVAALDAALAKSKETAAPPAVQTSAADLSAAHTAETARQAAAAASAQPSAIADMHKASVVAAVERYMTAGKIPPAAREQAIAACGSTAETLRAAVEYWEVAPVVVPQPARAAAAPAANSGGKLTPATMTDRQKKMCRDARVSAEDFCKQVNGEV